MNISDKHPFLKATSDMLEVATPLQKLGITYFTYTKCEADGGRTYLTTHPQLLKKYIDEAYYLIGNVEGPPQHYHNQILFWDTLPKQHIYEEIPRAHDIDHGIFIVNKEEDYSEFYGFAAKKGNAQIINAYINNLDILKNFMYLFKEKAQKILNRANASKLILSFHNDTLDFIKEFSASIFDKNSPINLSVRQENCATLLLQGMSYKEIARALKISPRTVETHVNILKKKLNCSNKAQLIFQLGKHIK